MSNDTDLSGHCTLLIDGESFTFPLPRFAWTKVTGWGPGTTGTFEQRLWDRAEVADWTTKKNRCRAAAKRWAPLRRLRLRLPMYVDLGYDDDGENLGRVWRRVHVGPWLADLLTPEHPGPAGSHVVQGCRAEWFCLLYTEGVAFIDNFIGTPAPEFGAWIA